MIQMEVHDSSADQMRGEYGDIIDAVPLQC